MIKYLAGGAALVTIAAQMPLLAQAAPPPPSGVDMRGPMAMHGMPPLKRADIEARIAEHFAAADLNHDGVLTRDELAKVRREHSPEAMMKKHRDEEFAMLDKDKNGSLSREEFDSPPPPPPPPAGEVRRMAGMPGDGPMPPLAGMHGGEGGRPMIRRIVMRHMGGPGGGMMGEAWFDRADANKDDKVTLAEAKASALAMFDRADRNHDGTITPDERRIEIRTFRHGPGMMRGAPGMPPPPPVNG